MSTYQSVQSATVDNSGTLIITKPTGLAVGDLLVAGIYADRDGGFSASLSTTSGWTAEANQDTGIGNGAVAVFTKVADSADVAASDFAFSATGSTGQLHMIGHLLRFTNYGQRAGVTSAALGGDVTTLPITGFTPSPALSDAVYLVFTGRTFGTLPATFVSVAMATSNPTWTNRAESTVSGSTTSSRFTVYTATRPETTTTGDFTVTFPNTDNIRTGGVAIAFNPRIDGSITPTTYAASYAFTPIQSVVIEGEVTSPTTETTIPTIWTTTSKS